MTTKKPAREAKPASRKRTAKPAAKSSARTGAPSTKADIILTLLGRPNGASTAELAKATDWQAHSVRGFLSGTLKKKKRGLTILADRSSGETRYRLGKG